MLARITPSPLKGTVPAIASKSMAHRLIICAALANGETHVTCNTTCADIEATVRCLTALGAHIETVEDGFQVHPTMKSIEFGLLKALAGGTLDCGESGSTLRFMLPVACALGAEATFVGQGRLGARPLSRPRSVLFIGNSFTKDAVEHIPGLLAAAGIKDIKLYHMYYGGRRVYEYNDGYTSSVDYHCYRCENGATSWTDVTGHSLHEIVSSDKWDIVTIQEHTGRAVAWDWTASQKSAFQGLVDKIKADCPDKTPDFYFIMSQAYHDMNKIATADRGQINFTTTEEMYNVIVGMTKKLMADIPFKDVIATGTCLQNLRTSDLNNGMCLTRDGYHMDYGISRYAAACMVFEKLISPSFDNVKLDKNTYRYGNSSTTSGSYSTPVTDANAPVALQAARYALQTPYQVTSMK